MFRSLTNFVRRQFGEHVCDEFTQWCEPFECDMINTRTWNGIIVSQTPYVATMQRRQCTLCGKAEERRIG